MVWGMQNNCGVLTQISWFPSGPYCSRSVPSAAPRVHGKGCQKSRANNPQSSNRSLLNKKLFVNVRGPQSHCGLQTIYAAKQFPEFKSTPFEKEIVWPFGGSKTIFGVQNPISGFNLAPIVAKVFHLQPPVAMKGDTNNFCRQTIFRVQIEPF